MIWFYVMFIVLFLYYTNIYSKLPDPVLKYFKILEMVLPECNSVNNDIEGIYESDFKQHGFNKHFMITKDVSDDNKLVSIKYGGSKSPTDDPTKLLEKEIEDMKKNALDVSYELKTAVVINDKKYEIFGKNATRDGTTLIFKDCDKTIKYFKIRDI